MEPPEIPGRFSFDDNNRQTKANNVALSYDQSGHLLNDGSRKYVWDDRDRLSEIQQGGTTIPSFSYDALGRRTVKTEGGTSTQYLYDGQDVVQETQGSTVNPILTGLGIDQRYARNDTGGRTYFLTDHLGSTRLLTNAAGGVVQRYEYDPYGTTTQSSTAYTNPYQYTGREKDASGLYYYRARYYRSQWGRFISEDPVKLAGGVNGYAYVGGNPNGKIDPLGLADVYIWMPLPYTGGIPSYGKLHSTFGHVSVDAYGQGFSYGPAGNTIDPWYSSNQHEIRDAVIHHLDMSLSQEKALATCLSKDQGKYGVTNNCGSPLQNCLREMGMPLSPLNAIFPETLNMMLYTSPAVTKSYSLFQARP